MADDLPNRAIRVLRFAALLLIAFLADGVLLHLLLSIAPWPLPVRAVSLLAAFGMLTVLRRALDVRSNGDLSIGQAGITALVVIALLLNYGLYAALITTMPDLQPLAAAILASAASLLFAMFGYARFAFRA